MRKWRLSEADKSVGRLSRSACVGKEAGPDRLPLESSKRTSERHSRRLFHARSRLQIKRGNRAPIRSASLNTRKQSVIPSRFLRPSFLKRETARSRNSEIGAEFALTGSKACPYSPPHADDLETRPRQLAFTSDASCTGNHYHIAADKTFVEVTRM